MYEAKRRPEIQELVDKVDQLTDADIDAAVVPLPWFRQALKLVREKKIEAARNSRIEANIVLGVNPEKIGRVFLWPHDTTYVQTSAITTIELKFMEPYFVLDDGGVYIGYSLFKMVDPRLLAGTLYGENKTKSDYHLEYKHYQDRRL